MLARAGARRKPRATVGRTELVRAPGLLLACIASLAVTAAVSAQTSVEGSLRGLVRDAQGAVLPGAAVSAASAASSVVVRSVTDARGSYRLTNLPPGLYTVDVALSGFSRVHLAGVEIRAGLDIAMDIAMEVGSLDETVHVAAETPMLEVQKPAQAVNISGDMQRQLPLTSKRDWYSFLEVTPSLVNRSVDQSGGQVYMLRGTDIEGHVFQLDGMDVGSFRQSRADVIQLNADAIEDAQVKTGGVDASAPVGVGVVVNVATKSGTNRLSGAAGALFTGHSWNGTNADAGASTASNELFQADASLGGPIRKDRAFFFGAFRYSSQVLGISRSPQQLAYLEGLVPGFAPFDNENRSHCEYVKVTAQLTPNHQLIGFYQNDLSPQDANWPYNGSDFERISYGGRAYGARFSSQWGSAITTRFAASFNDKTMTGDWSVFEGHQNPGPAIRVYAGTGITGGHLAGSGLVAALNNTTSWVTAPTAKWAIQGDATYYASGRGGSHEVQAGFVLQPANRNRNEVRFPNAGQNLVEGVLRDAGAPSAGYVVFHRRQLGAEAITYSSVEAQDYGFHVQDSWKPADRLTLAVGLRADLVKTNDLIFDTTIENAWNVAPRLGATWRLTDEGRSVLRGSYAIVHDMPQAVLIASIGSTRNAQADYYDNDLDGVFETAIVIPPSTALDQSREIDPDLHRPFIREAVIGIAQQFPGRWSVDLALVRRDYRDRPALVEVNGIYEGVTFKGYRNEALNDVHRITNNTHNRFVYSGLQVSVAKRGGAIQVLGGYTRGWQHVAGTWQPNDPASFIQPEAFANDKGIGTWRGLTTSSLDYSADARSPSWQKHVVRAGGTFSLPWNLTVATVFTLLSGPYSGPIYTTVAAPDPRFGPPVVTLSNGRRVSNPLATTYRFAYATRGDGQIQAPTMAVWNLGVRRDFRIGAAALQLAFDVFNVTNNGADQQFLDAGNVVTSANYALKDGEWHGQNRQAPRIGQLSVRYRF